MQRNHKKKTKITKSEIDGLESTAASGDSQMISLLGRDADAAVAARANKHTLGRVPHTSAPMEGGVHR